MRATSLSWFYVCLMTHLLPVGVFAGFSLNGQEFPDSVAGIEWQGATNFGGAGGVGVAYKGQAIKTDIYYYIAGDAALKDRSVDERLAAECVQVSSVMDEMVKRGYYSDLQKGEVKDVVSNGLTFVRLEFKYVEKGLPRHAYVHIAKHNDKLLKVRVTIENSTDQNLVEKALSEASFPFNK